MVTFKKTSKVVEFEIVEDPIRLSLFIENNGEYNASTTSYSMASGVLPAYKGIPVP
jgi:hypothetical protein